ncbi:Negative regulator of mitotic exit [Entomortierella chlamydospora]|uniref:Negative regulator of mitotic exit n=1 Tax=Entomortierella chlamydospora TaxID=101097 RepID=A0A9P6T0I2_9FUNG|nr:Negative regulator of mitotic exit [Entomortierella chlamydospora]
MAGLFTKKKKDDNSNKDNNKDNNNAASTNNAAKQRPAPPPNGLGLNTMGQNSGYQSNNGSASNLANNPANNNSNMNYNENHSQGYQQPPPPTPTGSALGPMSPMSPPVSQSNNSFGFPPQQQQQQQQQTQPGAGPPPSPQLFWAQRRIVGSNPFPRFQHSSSVTTTGTDIFLFGGSQRGVPKSDFFIIDSVSLQSQAISPAGADPPMPKGGHSAVNIGQYIIYFGGWDQTTGQCDDSLHVFHTARKEWNKPLIQGPLPTPRHSHTGCSVGTTMYIFGGQVDDYYLGDIVSFDMKSITQNPRWEVIEPQSESPPARSGHCAAVFEGKIYIFGGADADYFYNDIWCFDTRACTWTPIPASGYLPPGRHGHSCTIVDGVLYVFGGNSPDGTELNDAYAFKIHERRWYLFQSVGPAATPRFGHSMCTIKDKIFVLGGESEQSSLEDPALIYYIEIPKIRFSDATSQAIPPRQVSSTRLASTDTPPSGHDAGQQQQPPAGSNRPDRPARPERPLTQRPASPATFAAGDRQAQGNNTNVSQRPLTSIGTPPPRGTSAGIQNGGAGGAGQDYQGDGVMMAARRQTLKEDASLAYDGPRAASPVNSSGANRRPFRSNNQDNSSASGELSPTATSQISVPSQQQQARGPSNRSPSPATVRSNRATPTPPPQQTAIANQVENGDMTRLRQLELQIKERDEELASMRKRENWLVTEVMLARQLSGSDQRQNQQLAQTNEKRLSIEDLEQEFENRKLEGHQLTIAKSLLKLKEELRNTKMSIATQAQAASVKIKEAERIRTGALQEAAYLKAKLSSMSNAQQDPGALARVEMERAADLEKRLTTALGEMEILGSQLNKAQESLQQERLARLSADERSNNSSILAEQAQTAHDRALAELSSLHSRATKAEAESREYAAQLAESQAGFSGHQSQSTGLLQKIADLRHQVEEHQTALERTQMAYSAANDRAIRAEELCDESSSKLEKLESVRSELASELTRYKGEAERLQSKVEELEGRWQISKDEVITLRKLVEDGLGAFNPRGKTQELSAERKHDSIAILNTVSKVSGLEQELNSLKALHKSSQAAASKSAGELADAMIKISLLEQSSMKSRAETISLQKLLAEEREGNSELRNELSRTEQELQEKIKELENNEVQLGLLKDVMREKGIIAEDVMLQAAIRGSGDYAATLEDKFKQSQQHAKSLEQELEEAREHFTQQLEAIEAQRQATVQHSEKTSVLLRKLKNDLASTMMEKEVVEQTLKELQESHARCGEQSMKRDGQNKQQDERIQMLQMHWDEEQVQTLNEAISEQLETMQEEANKFKKKAIAQEMQLKSDVERLVNEVHQAQEALQASRSGSNSDAAMVAFAQQRQELEQRLKKSQETIQILEGDNSVLEARLQDSEKKVALLLEDMQHSLTDASNPNSPLNSANLAGVHQQLNQQISRSLGQSSAALNAALSSSSNSHLTATNRDAPRSGSSNSNSSRRAGASPSGHQTPKKNSPSPSHYVNEDDLYHYGSAAPQNGNHYMNGQHLGVDDGEDINSGSYRDSVDSITRELEMLKVPWNKASGGANGTSGSPASSRSGRKSSSPLYQQQQYNGNGNSNRYMYNDDDDEEVGVSYLAHLQRPSHQQQQQQQQQQQSNYNAGRSGTMDTHSFNDRSPSRLKEYEQMIDEIENARRQH